MLDPTIDFFIKAISHFSSEYKKRRKTRADVRMSAFPPAVLLSESVNPAQGSPVTVEQDGNLTSHGRPNHGVV